MATSDTSRQSYTILPLKWKKSKPCGYQQRFEAHTSFGTFFVERYRQDWDDDKPWMSWNWGYCFDEYYDEHHAECESADEGKRLSQEEWERRIMPHLGRCE